MPRLPTTQGIDGREWESRKKRILELYSNQGLQLQGRGGVREIMSREGFHASPAQYEHRFKKWGIRKNKTRAEWERFFSTEPAGEDTQAGRMIPAPKLKRARRRYALGVPRGMVPSLGPRPNIIACTPMEADILVSHESNNANQAGSGRISESAVATGMPSTENALATMTPAVDITQIAGVTLSRDEQFDIETDDYDNFLGYGSHMDPGRICFDLSPREPRYYIQSEPLSSIHNPNLVEFILGSYARETPTSRQIWLRPLPSSRLVAIIIKSTYSQSLAHLPNIFSNTNPVQGLLHVVTELTQKPRGSRTIRLLDDLGSPEIFAGEDWGCIEKLPDSIACEARFDGRLITSVVNGFAGLKNIPAAGVLKFLVRHPTTRLEMFKFLNIHSSPIVKSFAENIFQACVESDNIDAVKYLLDKKLVDANKAVCHFNGERYTSLEFASMEQSFSVVGHLISQVDVNKTFPRRDAGNALCLLIYNVADRRATLNGRFMQLIDAFLRKNAIVSTKLVKSVLRSFVDTRLAHRLLQAFGNTQKLYTLLLKDDLLRDIVMAVGERGAAGIIELTIDEYRNIGGERDMQLLGPPADNAFRQAVEDKRQELVEILLPYTTSLYEALQIAKDAGNQTAIQLVLSRNPALKAFLSLEMDEEGRSLVSALESNDQDRLRLLERNGAFDRLQGQTFGKALTAALTAGNEKYATKILDLDPDFEFYEEPTHGLDHSQIFDMYATLTAALTHGLDDIAWKLLSVGFMARRHHMGSDKRPPLLGVVLETKRLDFMKPFLEYGMQRVYGPTAQSEILGIAIELAIESGEDSIFDRVLEATYDNNDVKPPKRALKLALEKKRDDWFFKIAKSGRRGESWFTRSLKCAIKCEAVSVFDGLISLGARVDDDGLIDTAARKRPSMVKPLLDRYWKAYPQGRAGYGRSIIFKALREYPTAEKYLPLDTLFDLNLIIRNHLLSEPQGMTLLTCAIETGNHNIVKKFIDAGSDVNFVMIDPFISLCTFSAKTTALLIAIETGFVKIVQLLLESDADVNKPAQFGIRRTPLQKAAEIDNLPIVHLLLDHGADVNGAPAMFDGGTALQLAAIHGNCEIATVLIEKGARADIPPPRGVYGRWPIEGAAENGRFDMLELLWNRFGSFPEEQCQSAMRRAERNGHFGCKEKIEELMGRQQVPDNMSLPTSPQLPWTM
ncbi:hypothetical protein F5Y14DRAFT_463945 [Nemania sp. NC0429]|nr:hypothetical protein F5Y14DRAFT_463945 [Nemania sp. NC0429]